MAKRVQNCEDRLGMVTRRRIKVVEMAGSQLSHILPNTNPWAGSAAQDQTAIPATKVGVRIKRKTISDATSCMRVTVVLVLTGRVGGKGKETKEWREVKEKRNVCR